MDTAASVPENSTPADMGIPTSLPVVLAPAAINQGDATAAAVSALLSLAQAAEALAASLEALDLPARDLLSVAAEVRRLNLRLAMVEEALGALGQG